MVPPSPGGLSLRNPSLTLFLLSLISTASIMMTFPLLSIYLNESFQASVTEVGTIIALTFVSSFLSRFGVGFLVTGRRILPAMIIGQLVLVVSQVGLAVAADLVTAILMVVALGFASAISWTIQMAAVTTLSAESSIMVRMRTYTLALGGGFTIGPAVGAIVVGALGVRWVFGVAAILALVALPVALAMRRFGVSPGGTVQDVRPSFRVGLGLLGRPGVLVPAIAFGNLVAVYSLAAAYVPLYAKRVFGLGESEVFLLFFGLALVTLLCRLPLSRSFSVAALRFLFILSLGSASLALLLIGLGQGLWVFTLGVVLLGVEQGVVLHLGAVVVSASTSLGERVLGNAIYQAGQDVGGFAAPLVASVLIPALGIPNTLAVFALLPFGVVALTLASKVFSQPSG